MCSGHGISFPLFVVTGLGYLKFGMDDGMQREAYCTLASISG